MKKITKEKELQSSMPSIIAGQSNVNDESMEDFDMMEKETVDARGQEEDTDVLLRHRNRHSSKKTNGQAAQKPAARQSKPGNPEAAPVRAEVLPSIMNKELFTELAGIRGRCCVSMYMAGNSGNEEATASKNKTVFKHELQEITSSLRTQGFEEEYICQLLQPAQDLMNNDDLWNLSGGGLGLFVSDGFCKYIQMPIAPLAERMINSEFLITPLVSLMETNEYFYLLVISKQSAKLFKGDEWGMKIVPVDLPQNLEEARGLNTLANPSARRAKKRAQTTTEDNNNVQTNPEVQFVDKNDILGYFEAVDDALWDQVLNRENAPLLLAAVEYEIPIYKNACDYHNVWPQALTGNRDQQETGSLFEDAKQLIQPYFDKKQMRALENYANNSATPLTSTALSEIIPASYYARVSHLFVCRGARTWGTFDEMNNELLLMEDHEEGSENLINSAVVKTILNGGAVFVLEQDQMPGGSELAAILRF